MDEEAGDILKVGMASGKGGIGGRVNQYRANPRGYLENPSSSASVIKRAQETDGRRLRIGIYYLPIDPVEISLMGVTLSISPARDLEEALATRARKEGHSLCFSKNT